MQPKKDKCLLCKQTIFDQFWVYIWRNKRGYCCDGCGKAIHVAGYKIITAIQTALQRHGVEDVYSKEKFGFYRIDATVNTPDQLRLAEALFQQAKKDFPEFPFDFHAWLRHTNVSIR